MNGQRPATIDAGGRGRPLAVTGSRCRRRSVAATCPPQACWSPLTTRRDPPAHGLPPVPLVLSAGLALDQRPRSLRDLWTARHRLLLALRPTARADHPLLAGRTVARPGAQHVARWPRAVGDLARHRGLQPRPDHDSLLGCRASRSRSRQQPAAQPEGALSSAPMPGHG
jgi:hypothetical protein